jgi:hypothetical protein
VTGADNQQERLDGYTSGYVDGEGSVSIDVNRNPSCKSGYQLVPEFHVSQNGDRAQVLSLIQRMLGGAATSSGMACAIVRWSLSFEDEKISSKGGPVL